MAELCNSSPKRSAFAKRNIAADILTVDGSLSRVYYLYDEAFSGQITDFFESNDANILFALGEGGYPLTVLEDPPPEKNTSANRVVLRVTIDKTSQLFRDYPVEIFEYALTYAIFATVKRNRCQPAEGADLERSVFYHENVSELFKCLGKGFFHLRIPDSLSWKITGLQMGRYVWHANSCYLDHLVMFMFANASSLWLRSVEDSDPTVHSEEKLRAAAEGVKSNLLRDYDRIRGGSAVKCSLLRQQISSLVPRMTTPAGRWTFLETLSMYNAFCDLFPGLSYPLPIIERGERVVRHVNYATVDSYMLPADNDSAEKTLWGQVNGTHLVFLNTGSIKILSEVGKETNKIPTGKTKTEQVEFTKTRSLGWNITLGVPYTLVGVIRLSGYRPPVSYGNHYYTYFMSIDRRWYRYDSGETTGAVPLARPKLSRIIDAWSSEISELIFYVRDDQL